jgi:glycosyltransferase involved in cell wall biosynthesis
MRIAIVVNTFPSLSESFIFNKVMGLRAAGLDITVIAHNLRDDRALFADRLNNQPLDFITYTPTAGGVRHLPLKLSQLVQRNPQKAMNLRKEALCRYGRSRRALKAWVAALPLVTGNFDVIHFEYSGLAVSYLDALPLLAHARLLTSCRGAAEQITPLLQPERATKMSEVFALVDRVHCVSSDMLRTVEGYGLDPAKAFINHPSINASQFVRKLPYEVRSSGPYRLLSVGRLHWKKGLEYAILAMRSLVDAGYDVHYDILGGGVEEEKLRFTIAELNLGERVHLRGRQSAEAVREALEKADVYLLPSLSEGLSNAALEAMAMELPLVSTTAGGMAEAITHGKEGFLVPPWEPEVMAAKIAFLLKNGDLRLRMGQAGRARIEGHFNLERQINCFVEEYQALQH